MARKMLVTAHSVFSLSSNRDESRPLNPARFPCSSWDSLECSCRLVSSSAAPWSPPLRCSRLLRTPCFSTSQDRALSTSIEDLRRQLEVLHLEAEQARGRANAARARFMRLTETVENLRVRAIMDLKSGKEELAKQSIVEKQKVMQALEKSKQRAELLEELCNKLSEAISNKELQVMASLTSTSVEVNQSDAATENIRIVSPKDHDLTSDQVVNDEQLTDSVREEVTGTDEVTGRGDWSSNQIAEALSPDSQAKDFAMECDDGSLYAMNALPPIKAETYPDFLSRIDNHLHEAEMQLHSFLNIAAIVVPENVDKNTKERVKIVREIWMDVLAARARIKQAVHEDDIC